MGFGLDGNAWSVLVPLINKRFVEIEDTEVLFAHKLADVAVRCIGPGVYALAV